MHFGEATPRDFGLTLKKKETQATATDSQTDIKSKHGDLEENIFIFLSLVFIFSVYFPPFIVHVIPLDIFQK